MGTVHLQYLRQQSPDVNFFSGGLGNHHRTSLGYLLRATFQAHTRLAPISRRFTSGCQSSDDESGQRTHGKCWPQRRDDQTLWYSYFSPAPPNALNTGEDITNAMLTCCCRDTASKASNLLEPVTRVAVSEDAARLWRLLLPDCYTQTDTSALGNGYATVTFDFSPSSGPSTSNPSLEFDATTYGEGSPASQTIRVLWEDDITFLLVNLLFLRPGLEEEKRVAGECQHLRSLRAIKTTEADIGTTAGGNGHRLDTPWSLAACDEGFSRPPIGDSHEAFLPWLFWCRLCSPSRAVSRNGSSTSLFTPKRIRICPCG
ncbi:unnamed protein product [Schistocephalus solidus]|uniref:Uncharacterized protein n=1 Tax=Schistocephalus solidus TaxID=70667 RepID=A0A183TKT5_SCHSO|nr:unnamed protein product [Schistocephalus solidus]